MKVLPLVVKYFRKKGYIIRRNIFYIPPPFSNASVPPKFVLVKYSERWISDKVPKFHKHVSYFSTVTLFKRGHKHLNLFISTVELSIHFTFENLALNALRATKIFKSKFLQ